MTSHKHTSPSSGQQKNTGKGQADKKAPAKNKQGSKGHKQEDWPDADEEPVREADFDPNKSIQIDDNPEETKRKIPNMKN